MHRGPEYLTARSSYLMSFVITSFITRMDRPLPSLVPNAADLLALEVEELAGVLLTHLNSAGNPVVAGPGRVLEIRHTHPACGFTRGTASEIINAMKDKTALDPEQEQHKNRTISEIDHCLRELMKACEYIQSDTELMFVRGLVAAINKTGRRGLPDAQILATLAGELAVVPVVYRHGEPQRKNDSSV